MAEETGIPRTTLTQMIKWTCSLGASSESFIPLCGIECTHAHNTSDWALYNYGIKYGISVKYFGERGHILDTEFLGLRDYVPEYWEGVTVSIYPTAWNLPNATISDYIDMENEDGLYDDDAASALGDFVTKEEKRFSPDRLATMSASKPEKLYANLFERL